MIDSFCSFVRKRLPHSQVCKIIDCQSPFKLKWHYMKKSASLIGNSNTDTSVTECVSLRQYMNTGMQKCYRHASHSVTQNLRCVCKSWNVLKVIILTSICFSFKCTVVKNTITTSPVWRHHLDSWSGACKLTSHRRVTLVQISTQWKRQIPSLKYYENSFDFMEPLKVLGAAGFLGTTLWDPLI